MHAQNAVAVLNGSNLGGQKIRVGADPMSKDGSKLIVHNIPGGMEWQEVKAHFEAIGPVAFCDCSVGGKGKGGKGKGKGMGGMGGMGKGMGNGMVAVPAAMLMQLKAHF